MKNGKTIQELAAEIARQAETRKDFVAPVSKLSMVPMASDCAMQLGDREAFNLKDLAHRQVGDHVGVPAKYYDRMRRSAPAQVVQTRADANKAFNAIDLKEIS